MCSAKLTAVNKPEIPKLYSKVGEFVGFVCLFLNQNSEKGWKQSKLYRRGEVMLLLQAHLRKERCCLPSAL